MVPVVAKARDAQNSVPSAHEVLEQLERLLASRQFRESHQLHAFLKFIVRETLDERGDSLKEYVLGTTVFGRRTDYDPRHDGIVRVQATAIRKRLDKYYSEEGRSDAIGIELPRGGYVPTFHYRPQTIEDHVPPMGGVQRDEVPKPVPPVVVSDERRSWPRFVAGGIAVGVLLFFAGYLLGHRDRPAAAAPFVLSKASPTDFPELWAPFFAKGAQNVVAYGVPLFFSSGGLYMRDVRVNVPEAADRGVIKDFAHKLDLTPLPQDDIYTGVGELEATQLVSNFLATRGAEVHVKSARAIGPSSVAQNNLFVISSLRFRTLLTDLHLPTAFDFVPVAPETIRMRSVFPNEPSEYVFGSGAGVSTSYGAISVWPGSDAQHRIVHVGGVHTWATQAATEFLLDPAKLQRLARHFRDDRVSGAHGTVSPYFQIIVRVEGRENRSQTVEYVTHRYLPQVPAPKGS